MPEMEITMPSDAVAMMVYRHRDADPGANDIWPSIRKPDKIPASYYLLGKTPKVQPDIANRPAKALKKSKPSNVTTVPVSSKNVGRPTWGLPTELVALIASYLNRDDIKAMRLVSKEIEHHVSPSLFETVVVPFNSEIYGMLEEQDPDLKGKKKAGISNFAWKNANGDDVYNGHGLDVFRGFGDHILRFGMSFEVNEETLAKPPQKRLTEVHKSYWGEYEWPFENYRRFEDVAGIETAADETPRMKTAFSELSKVNELALSVDAGLGWLNGLDRSIRSRILQRAPAVFGTLKEIPDRRTQAQEELWQHIRSCQSGRDLNITQTALYKIDLGRCPQGLKDSVTASEKQPNMPFVEPYIIQEAISQDANMQIPMSSSDQEILDQPLVTQVPSPEGILFTSKIQTLDSGRLFSSLNPSSLTQAQKEWLLETEWAQRAFLSSYMLSVIDNPNTFMRVHTLNIARLSDRYVYMLNRPDFWDALPGLRKVTLMVIPSWRDVHKDVAGFVDTPKINPSTGLNYIYKLLYKTVSNRRSINDLTLGWAAGGEHAEGVHARNKLILPAPLVPLRWVTDQDPTNMEEQLLQFPSVKRLTLKNCWITPSILQKFVKLHDKLSLEELVFDSVSLTGVLRQQQNGNNNMPAHAWAPPPPLPFAQVAQGNAQGQQVLNQNPFHMLQTGIQALQNQIQQLQNQPAGSFQLQIATLQQHQQQLMHQMFTQTHIQAMANNTMQNGNALTANLHAPQPAGNAPWQLQQTQQLQYPFSAMTASRLCEIQPREGSWMNTIDIITPGPSLREFGSKHSQADPQRRTSLQSIAFVSCGYVRLPNVSLEQDLGDDMHRRTPDSVFVKRGQALLPSMLNTRWPELGEIVQEGNSLELAALETGWNLMTGWRDKEKASAPCFDGWLPGGTGRFTGIVRASDRVDATTC